MRNLLVIGLLWLAVFSVVAKATDAPASSKDMPISVWIEYCESDGNAFRLMLGKDYHSGIVFTRYSLNWQFDAHAKEKEIQISAASWKKFQVALKAALGDGFPQQKFDPHKAKLFCTIYVEYPGLTIRAAVADSPSLRRDFAAVRRAVGDLTDGVVVCRSDISSK